MKNLKDLNLSAKIIGIILSILLVSEIVILAISYANMSSLGDYCKTVALNLGEYSSKMSEEALKQQSETYLKKVCSSTADLSNETLKDVSKHVLCISESLEKIYQNKENFKGHIPPLPETVDNKYASEKVYAVDSKNSIVDSNMVLAFDPGNYDKTFEGKIYKTDITHWNALTDEDRTQISSSKIVLSPNPMPSDIKNEISNISNIAYTLAPIFDNTTCVSSFYVATKSGILYRYSKDSLGTRLDARSREWYVDAVNSRQEGKTAPIWQSPYVDKYTGQLCITCCKAFIGPNSDIIGVVGCDMYLTDLNEYVLYHNSEDKEAGYSFLLDEEGNIVMHPDYLKNDNHQISPISGDIDDSYRNALSNMKQGKSGIEKVKIEDMEYYLAYTPMKETGWSFGILSRIEDIVKPASETKNVIAAQTYASQEIINHRVKYLILYFLLIFVLCCIVSAALAVFLSFRAMLPLKRLKMGVKKIGQGDLSFKLNVHSRDEIGQLAECFNNMTQNLQKHIDNLAETTAEKERVQSELSIAKKIQLSMLPCIFPAFPERKDFDIFAMTDPAKEVGGDFYDFFFIDDSHLAIVIADVSEKGISAALFMVISKILIQNQLKLCASSNKTLEAVNNQLYENNDADMFVTAFVGIYDINTGELEFSNAGHIPPLLYRKGRDRFEYIKMKHGIVLAGVKDVKYEKYKINLSPEDVLFMYTDGVTEATNSKLEMFSDDRLKEILNQDNIRHLSIRDLIIAVNSELKEFARDVKKSDDITIMALKILKQNDSKSIFPL